jgi:hypothetical protein
MELLLFPSVTECANLKTFAAFFITCNKSTALPILTKFSIIPEEIRLSSEILKIVRIYTLSFIMIVIKRAPFCFEEKNVKVKILIHRKQMMEEADLYIFD